MQDITPAAKEIVLYSLLIEKTAVIEQLQHKLAEVTKELDQLKKNQGK